RLRAAVVGAQYEAIGACASAARSARCAAWTAAANDSGSHSPKGSGDEARRNAAQPAARFRAQNVGVGDVEVDAGDREVEVVFKSEQHRVRQTQINLAVLHQLVEARCIAEACRWNAGGRVNLQRVRKPLMARIVDARIAEVKRSDGLRRRHLRQVALVRARGGCLRRWDRWTRLG